MLMDVQLPDMDGYDATRIIRGEERARDAVPVPILAMTANPMDDNRRACLEAGMDGFIAKPVNREGMIRMIDESLSTHGVVEMSFDSRPAGASAEDGPPAGLRRLEDSEILDRIVFGQFSSDVGADYRDALDEEFASETTGKVTSIAAAIAERNFAEAQRLSHSLKSGAGTFGAVALQKCAERIELASAAADSEALAQLHREGLDH